MGNRYCSSVLVVDQRVKSAYDANGNRTGIITPEGYHITRGYDCLDRLIMERLEDRENGTDLKTFFTYDKAGNLTQSRENGKTAAQNEYDRKNRIVKNTDADGIEDEQREIYTASARKTGKPAQRFTYDAKGNITRTEDGRGNRTSYTLDNWGASLPS